MLRSYLVYMSGETSEFKKFMSLEVLRQPDVVEVIEAVDRVTQCLVVFFLNEQLIVGIVDGLDIELYSATD